MPGSEDSLEGQPGPSSAIEHTPKVKKQHRNAKKHKVPTEQKCEVKEGGASYGAGLAAVPK